MMHTCTLSQIPGILLGKKETMPSAMRGARPPLYESRPDGVLEAIRDKFAAARPGGWLQDSADNYEFLSFGSGVAAVEALAKRARPGEVVAILDAGAGSGGFMAQARDVCARHAIPARIVGTTARSTRLSAVARLCPHATHVAHT